MKCSDKLEISHALMVIIVNKWMAEMHPKRKAVQVSQDPETQDYVIWTEAK